MQKLPILLMLLWLALSGWALAAGFEVYLNNRPFPGAVCGPASDVLVEAEPYFRVVGGDYRFDAGAGSATVDGKPLEVQLADGKVFVRAREAVTLCGGRYTNNAELGTVDLYAFDPVEAARKSFQRMLNGRSIQTPEQLTDLNSLVQPLLVRKLGLDLRFKFPVSIALLTPEHMNQAAGRNTPFFTHSVRDTHGSGVIGSDFALRTGQRPAEAIAYLAIGWGHVWAVAHGRFDDNGHSIPFGLLAADLVLTELGAPGGVKALVERHTPAEQGEYRRLLELYRLQGAEAVLRDVGGR